MERVNIARITTERALRRTSRGFSFNLCSLPPILLRRTPILCYEPASLPQTILGMMIREETRRGVEVCAPIAALRSHLLRRPCRLAVQKRRLEFWLTWCCVSCASNTGAETSWCRRRGCVSRELRSRTSAGETRARVVAAELIGRLPQTVSMMVIIECRCSVPEIVVGMCDAASLPIWCRENGAT